MGVIQTVKHPTDVFGEIPSGTGGGPILPAVMQLDNGNNYNFPGTPFPTGKDVTFEFQAGGGGGAARNSAGGGGGGGGGGYAIVKLTAAQIAAGGTLTLDISAAGNGGAAGADSPGTDADDIVLALDTLEEITIGGGKGSTGAAGGVAGAVTIDPVFETIISRNGSAGLPSLGNNGGRGGQAGGGGIYGAGGLVATPDGGVGDRGGGGGGGFNTTGDGGNGGPMSVFISWDIA